MSKLLERLAADHRHLQQVFDVLRSVVDSWAEGKTPDLVLVHDCIGYCANYCDLAHHAREDIMYERMLAKDRAATEGATVRLDEAHRRLAELTRDLQRETEQAARLGDGGGQQIKASVDRFLEHYRQHMAMEEENLFPLADRLLDADDWRAIDARDPAQSDPLFSDHVDKAYSRLYARIVEPYGPVSVELVPGLEAENAQADASSGDADNHGPKFSFQYVRFGDFVRENSVHEESISYNALTPKLLTDEDGKEIPYHPPPLRVRGIDIYRLLAPYLSVRAMEQIKAVVPLALYLVLFQILVLRQGVDEGLSAVFGLTAVIAGLMLFMEGLKLGLMPFGEVIGDTLPKKSPLWIVLLVTFLLGIGVTFAEPAIGALQAAGALVDVVQAPYLYALLNEWAGALVLVVGAGVGLAAVLGTMRFVYGWSLKPYIYASLIPTLGLTTYIALNPDLTEILGLAWDCGAVTTGPVTVPLVLSLGIGIASATSKGNSSMSGFGIVTLASLFPIIGVMLLSIVVSSTVTPDEIMAAAQTQSSVAVEPTWYERTPAVEIIGGVRAIVPLVLFLFLIFKGLLRATLQSRGYLIYGLTLCVVGMCIFNIGLTYGLAALGNQSGQLLPAAFQIIERVANSPLYAFVIGIPIVIAFAWVLGFGATLAEPALNALGLTVENLTNGAFRKQTLMYAVSFGVACGIAVGVLKIIFNLPIASLLIPAYIAGIVLTALSSEEFVNVAWDSAGVTTGPVTVPLVLAMGLGLGDAVDAVEGFGILSMASIGPILSVLGTGLYVQWAARRRQRETYGAPASEGAKA
ncbi:MAG: DUF1538 family protein [Rhodobacteraceae bacterium]|nr:DUF1538 family protein [Paracoccaceae bacterium]